MNSLHILISDLRFLSSFRCSSHFFSSSSSFLGNSCDAQTNESVIPKRIKRKPEYVLYRNTDESLTHTLTTIIIEHMISLSLSLFLSNSLPASSLSLSFCRLLCLPFFAVDVAYVSRAHLPAFDYYSIFSLMRCYTAAVASHCISYNMQCTIRMSCQIKLYFSS